MLQGLQTTYGIDTVQISDFTELNIPIEDNVTGLEPSKQDQRARSFATITLRWEQNHISLTYFS